MADCAVSDPLTQAWPWSAHRTPASSILRCVEIPSVYAYLDYRVYLREWYEAKKAVNPRFSHRAFVRRTGRSSPSLLSDTISGRRNLTRELLEAFARALKLDEDEADYFAALVALDQAETDSERREAWRHVAATRRFGEAHALQGESYAFLTHWYYPVVRELTALEDFQEEPEWIARAVRPPITPEEAAQALASVVELGLVERVGDRLRPRELAVVTPPQVTGLAVHAYHQGMLALAREAIGRFRSTERHFSAMTVAVPEALLPELKRELDGMMRRFLEICDGSEADRERVIQVQLHFFPVSRGGEER